MIFLFSFSHLRGNFPVKNYIWEKEEINSKGRISFVVGKSDAFFLQSQYGELFYLEKNHVVRKLISPESPLKYLQYFQLKRNKFLFVATTLNWRGVVYTVNFATGNYKKILDENIPLKGVAELNGKYYIYGDFGLLLEYENDNCTVVETPFESHIVAAKKLRDKIYFSTMQNGVYSFDTEKIEKIAIPPDYTFSTELIVYNDTLFFLTENNILFKLDNSKLELSENETVKKLTGILPSDNFGFSEKFFEKNGVVFGIKLPRTFNAFDAQLFDDNSVLIFSNDNKLYYGKPSDKFYFTNLSAYYKIVSPANSNNRFVAFFDADNDGTQDLLEINDNIDDFISFYRGVNNAPFANITSVSGLPYNQSPIEHASISDVNNDGLKDIILQIRTEKKRSILIYANKDDCRFSLYSRFDLPEEMQASGIRNMTLFDYDSDGDNDIFLVSYYGKKKQRGHVSVFLNRYWGSSWDLDTLLNKPTRNWNAKILFGDLNNDNLTDIYLATFWTKDVILINRGGYYVNETEERISQTKPYTTSEVFLADIDNDADLDIITACPNRLPEIFLNNGAGYFRRKRNALVSENFGTKKLTDSKNLRKADFNNDGFTDFSVTLSFSDTTVSGIFINNKGKNFTFEKTFFDSKNADLNKSACADVDNDGDIDIYALSSKGEVRNMLWINSLDKKNFVKINLQTVLSAPDGYGTKIRLFKHGLPRTKENLLGYRETGTEQKGFASMNSFSYHFGLGNETACDVEVRFPSGKTIVKTNVRAGETVTFRETAPFVSFVYGVPGAVFRFVREKENQLYILIVIIAHLIIYFGLQTGRKKLRWNEIMIIYLGGIAMAIFWLSVYLSSFSQSQPLKFVAPLTVVFFTMAIALTISYIQKKNLREDYSGYNNRLLAAVMSFSHGEWALRNLNGLILLCENPPENWNENEQYLAKLGERLKTFSEMTSKSIREIIELETLLGNNPKETAAIEKSLKEISERTENRERIVSPRSLTNDLKIIREQIKYVRDSVYARFSSKPTEVINGIVENFEQTLREQKIVLKKVKKYSAEIPVLIKNYELGNILSNLFQNSIRAMQNSKNKTIEIKLEKNSPKILIEFTNTGEEIPEEAREKIFEQGFSKHGGTGLGLFQSREILKKYGARIYLKRSDARSTTFVIELNEGKNFQQ